MLPERLKCGGLLLAGFVAGWAAHKDMGTRPASEYDVARRIDDAETAVRDKIHADYRRRDLERADVLRSYWKLVTAPRMEDLGV